MKDSVALLLAALGGGAAVAALIVGIVGIADLATSSSPYELEGEARDKHAEELHGDVDWDDLTGDQQWEVYQQPGMEELYRETLEDRAERAGDVGKRAKAQLKFMNTVDVLTEWVDNEQKDDGTPYSPSDFRIDLDRAKTERGIIMDFIGDGRGADDPLVDGWYELTDTTRDRAGNIDWDRLEDLRQEYKEKHGKDENGEWKVDVALEAVEGIHDTPLERELREARKQNDEYRQIPIYNHLTVEESRLANTYDQEIRNLISTGQAAEFGGASAREMAYAKFYDDKYRLAIERGYSELQAKEEAEYALWLVMAAVSFGWSRERAAFRKDPKNALFQKFWYTRYDGWDDEQTETEEVGPLE